MNIRYEYRGMAYFDESDLPANLPEEVVVNVFDTYEIEKDAANLKANLIPIRIVEITDPE